MAHPDCEAFDADSIEALFEPTVEIPAALLLAAGCGCCCGLRTRSVLDACC